MPEQNIIKQIVWIDARHVVVNASYTGHGVIYYSNDGGRNFTSTLKNTGASETIVWDTSGRALYAVDNMNRFYSSRDNGLTWVKKQVKIPFEQRQNISHFCSLTSYIEHGRRAFYATTAYPGRIFRTQDTGRHWQILFADSIILRNREIPSLRKLQDGRYFAISAEGTVDAPGCALIGARSGRTWTRMPAPEGMWCFAELPSKPGFIVAGGFSLGRFAGDAALFISENYGKVWRSKQVLGAALAWQVEFLNSNLREHTSQWLLATENGLLQLNIHQAN